MALSTQLRLIILVAGGLMLLIIYLLGRRRHSSDAATPHVSIDPPRKPQTFEDVAPLVVDEEQFDEPSYLRRHARRDRSDVISIHDADDAMPLPSVRIDGDDEMLDDEPPAPVSTVRVPVLSMQDNDKAIAMKLDAPVPVTVRLENHRETATQTATPNPQRQLVALRLAMSESVSGDQLLAMFQAEQLQHGKFNIFHYMHNNETVFSVASLVEPGSFDLATMAQHEYRGLSLFMLLPGPLSAVRGFEAMLGCAQRLAQLTSGTVQDEGGVMLLESGIERLRSKVFEIEQSLQG